MKIFVHASTLALLVFLLSLPEAFSQTLSPTNDSITVAVAPVYDRVGSFHRFWLGEGYRKLWAAPVRIKVLHLESEKGGLTPVQMGGGFQTQSLRLQDNNGKQWVLRSVQKYPERRLPSFLRNTIAQRILQDQVVTVHPFGALTVPLLASALDVVHTNPQIVYVADDPALGPFRETFANSVLLFEERGAIDTVQTISTEAAQVVLESGRNVRVDQEKVLRARLLDFLLGDWDRHEGQWRWKETQAGNGAVFNPVPFDRDYVFYNTTGVLPWLVSRQYLNARFQGFDENIRDIEIYNCNNRFFDRYFLNALNEQDWKEAIELVQKTLTDDVLRKAVRQMPDTIVALTGPHIVETLIARRKNLKQDAMKYYRFLSETVDVPATEAADELQVQCNDDGGLRVAVFSEANGGTKVQRYERVFSPDQTKEIRLYGLGGNDQFVVSGTAETPIKIRMIGGSGADRFGVSESNPNKKRLFVYDRSDEANRLSANLRRRLGTDSSVNVYNRRSFRYNRSTPFFSLFYNVDDRTFVSLGWSFETQGFRKEPYASRHLVVGGYSPTRGSFAFAYDADWRHVFGKYGINFNFVSLGPRNLMNFFGTGNETVFPKESRNGKDILYYRNRYDLVHADLRIRRYKDVSFSLSAGLSAQYYASAEEHNRNRYLTVYSLAHPNEQVFLNRVFGGLGAGLQLDTRRGGLLTNGGVFWNLDLQALKQLRGESRSFGALRTDLTLYSRLSNDSGLVLVNRIGGGTTVGDPLFFQMMRLGGVRSLRGFNTARFTGRSMLYHNAELQVKLFHFTSYLFPGSVGLIGFNDVGRVWMPGETSTTWHDGYGGGLFIVPAEVVLIRAVMGHSAETTQFYLNLLIGLQ